MSLSDDVPGVLGLTPLTSYDVLQVDVDRQDWLPTVTAARDGLGLTFFDLLTAVEADDDLEVVLRLWAPVRRGGLLLRTRCPHDDPAVPTLTGVFAGAAWHERAAAELFGITFTGHDTEHLLLPASFQGHPLRKDFVLATRAVRPWPGHQEPGESQRDLARPGRRTVTPPGAPAPGTWG